MTLAVGIDLGTTNSAIAIRRLTTEILSNAEGGNLTPSCVLFAGELNQAIAGQPALDLMERHPEATIQSVKRLIGRDFAEPAVQQFIKHERFGYKLTTDPAEPGSILITIHGSSYRPEDISAIILRKILDDATPQLGAQPTHAVVTVPAYFSDRQKFCTQVAARQAGLEHIRLLPEPTAAAIAFGLDAVDVNDCLSLMVIDLGGGTFDMSVLSISAGHFMEVAKGGDMWLGGDDVDQLIVEHVLQKTAKKQGLENPESLLEALSAHDRTRFLSELRHKAELAKIELSQLNEANIECYGILRDTNGALVDIDETIGRDEFEGWLQPFLERLEQLTRALVAEIHFETELIDQVLMVGGSSLIPAVQKTMCMIFGEDKIRVHPRPLHAVAEGAAIWAQRKFSQDASRPTLELMHSVAHDYYLQLAGGQHQLLVSRHSPLPCFVDERLQFMDKDQELARLRVFNEVDGVLETVGELWLSRGQLGQLSKDDKPIFNLRFAINEDNIIQMSVWPEYHSERSVELVITRGGLVPKLYADLEQTLRQALSKDHDFPALPSCLDAGRIIAENIQRLGDPISLHVDTASKQQIFAQLQTLQDMVDSGEDPLGLVNYCEALQEIGLPLMTEDERTRFLPLAADYLLEAKHLLRFAEILKLYRSLDGFIRNLEQAEILDKLVRAELLAAKTQYTHPTEARRLRFLIQKSLDAWLSEGEDESKRIATHLVGRELATRLSSSHSRSFDRDVQRVEQRPGMSV